jgi:hypothetical protein
MKRTTLQPTLWIVLAFMFFTHVSIQAQPAAKQQYAVSENNRSTATVTMEFTDELRKVSIKRNGQPEHVYRSFLSAPIFTVHAETHLIFAYYPELSRISTTEANFSLREVNNQAKRYGRDDVNSIHGRLAADMRILRAVREYDAAFRLFETAFVIATGDESILQGEPSPSLRVSEITQTSAKMRKAAVLQDITTCKNDCRNTETRCLEGVPTGDRIRCYEASFKCQQNCDSIYKQPMTPPRPN